MDLWFSPAMASTSRIETTELNSQVGGHAGILMNEDGELVIKPALPRELAFYQQIRNDKTFSSLLPYVPSFIGTLRLEGEVDYSKPQEEGIAVKPFAEKKDRCFSGQVSDMLMRFLINTIPSIGEYLVSVFEAQHHGYQARDDVIRR